MHPSKSASVQEVTKVCLVMFPTGKLQPRSHGIGRGGFWVAVLSAQKTGDAWRKCPSVAAE